MDGALRFNDLGKIMPSKIRSPRLAVLIDADNASAKIADGLFEEIAKIGEASVRRIYGDFSNARSKAWADILSKHAIIPQQQFAYTTGKNASDITLVIDAMDLLHGGRFDGFAWCHQTAIYAACRPHPGARRRRVRVRRAEDTGKFSAGLSNSSIPKTCSAARRTTRMPPRGRNRSSPLMRRPPSSRRSSPRWKAKTGGSVSGRSENGLSTSPPISIRNLGSRKLSDLVRKTNAFEIEQPKGRNHANQDQAAGRITCEGASRPKTCGVSSRRFV